MLPSLRWGCLTLGQDHWVCPPGTCSTRPCESISPTQLDPSALHRPVRAAEESSGHLSPLTPHPGPAARRAPHRCPPCAGAGARRAGSERALRGPPASLTPTPREGRAVPGPAGGGIPAERAPPRQTSRPGRGGLTSAAPRGKGPRREPSAPEPSRALPNRAEPRRARPN